MNLRGKRVLVTDRLTFVILELLSRLTKHFHHMRNDIFFEIHH